MRIERIEASKHKRGRVLVFLADGACLKITEQELLDFGLRSGDELEEDTLRRLKDAAGVSGTKATAAELIGRRAMSRRDLERKLQNNESGFLPLDLKASFTPLERRTSIVDPSVLKFVDEMLLRMNFTRMMLEPVPNFAEATIYRMLGRYRAVISKNKTIHRR